MLTISQPSIYLTNMKVHMCITYFLLILKYIYYQTLSDFYSSTICKDDFQFYQSNTLTQ